MADPNAASKKWATEADWEQHREKITKMYCSENRTLAQLMEVMDKEHDFRATPKMYKSRFKRWGLWKYNKIADVAEILKHQKEGTMSQLPEELAIRSKKLDIQRAEKYVKRRMRTQAARLQQQRQKEASDRTHPHQNHQHMQEQLALMAAATRSGSLSPGRMSPGQLSPGQMSSTALMAYNSPSPELFSPTGFSPAGSPGYLRSPSPMYEEEATYRVIRDYYDGSFGRRTWNFIPGAVALAGSRAQISDLNSRFRIAMNLLRDATQVTQQPPPQQQVRGAGAPPSPASTTSASSPPPVPAPSSTSQPSSPAEGIKMMRICFAQLPEVLSSEDPALLNYILDIVLRLRESGLEFLEAQLLRHLHGLAATATHGQGWGHAGQPHSTALIWKTLRGGMVLDRFHASRCMQVVVNQFEKHLGPYHEQTIELMEWWILNRDPSPEAKLQGLRTFYADLEAALGDVFDARHLDVLMNLANHLRRCDRMEEAAAVLNVVFRDGARQAVLLRHPMYAFNFHWLMAKVCSAQGNHVVAEVNFRSAMSIAKTIEDGGGSEYLSSLLALEQCLRDQEKTEEADQLLAERQALVRETLEKVGEQENAV